MPRQMRPAPEGYEVLKLPALGRWVAVRLELDRTGSITALKPMVRDGRVLTYRTRARAVLELTVTAQALELEQLRGSVAGSVGYRATG